MRRSLVAVLAFLSLVAAVGPLHAQRITGQIVGTVTDTSGGALPGVTVTLKGEAVVGVQTATTNEKGFYRFVNLPPGTYSLSFALSGFSTQNRPGVKAAVGQVAEQNVSLGAGRAEEVTVVGETPVVDSQSNTVSTNYDKDWVRNAPVPRFSMFDLLAASPGVSQSSQGSTTMSAFGSGSDENSFQIDGTNLTSSSTGEAWPYPNTDAIEEIEVLSLGAPAEYGNVTGAVFNVVTRQGSNAFHGDANGYLQTSGLTGRNTTPTQECAGTNDPAACAASGGLPYHRESFHDYTFQLSGPILKDKLWFFASYQHQLNAQSPVGVESRFFTNEVADRVFGKLNWQISTNHKVALGYHNDYYTLPGAPDANSAPSTVLVNTGQNPTPNLMYTGVLSAKTVLEARVAGFWGDDHGAPQQSGQARVQPRFYNLDTGQTTGGVYYWYDDKTYQSTASVKVSHFADNFLGSSHDFKFGVQYVNGGVHDAISGTNDLIFTSAYDSYGNPGPRAYGYQYQPYSYGGTTHGVGVFTDDTVRVNDRLTLNLGARYDRNTGSIPELAVRDHQGNPTGDVIHGRDLFTWNAVAPRVGFKYKLTKDGKTVVGAHFGRYYRALVTAEYSSRIGVSPHSTSAGAYDLATGTFIDPVVTQFSQNQSIPTSYKNPYTDQFAASLERELAPNLGISLYYINKRAREGPAWEDTTGQYADATIIDDVGAGATGKSIVVKQLISDPADSRYELTNRSYMKTDTNAFTAQVTKRMSKGWQLIAAYTYLDSKGLLPSSRSSDGLLNRQNATARFSNFGQNPNDLVNATGKLLGDRPHTFKTQLMIQLPHGFLVGANYLFQSGRAWARRIRVTDLNNLGFPNAPNINLEVRDGSRRVPNQSNLDMRLQKGFSLGKGVKIDVFGDALNLLNSDTNQGVLSRNVDVPSDLGVASDYVLPRRFMLGAKLTF
jgi:outer membrane receptor protein involved in Fe transport